MKKTSASKAVSATWHAGFRRHGIAAALAAAFGTVAGPAWAQLPSGATVVNGSAGIATAGNRMTITNSPNAVLNWQAFSIGPQNSVRFEQPSSSSQVLNRVVGNDPSNILGSLSSNGGVWLVNPHGVLFGSNARIDVGGLVASTLAISNDDFLAGRFKFGGMALPSGLVLNRGEINTSFGGHVWLVGGSVRNEGLVRSPGGQIVLAAGKSIDMVDSGMPNVAVRVTASDNDAVNLGALLAPGGGSIDVHGGIVNQQGIVRADSVGTDPAGRVVIKASGDVRLGAASVTSASAEGTGPAGKVMVESIDGAALVQGRAGATSAGGSGGQIHLLGRNVGVDGQAVVDASGATGGGEVLAGGDYQGKNPLIRNAVATYFGPRATVLANAMGTGNGGKVIFWGDSATRVYGTVAARGGQFGGDGGFVETSGHVLDVRTNRISVGATKGKAGTWLLDPGDIHISDAGSNRLATDYDMGLNFTSIGDDATVNAGDIAISLAGGTNVIVKTGGAETSQMGNIYVEKDIVVPYSNSPSGALSLQAHNDIVMNAGTKIVAGGTPLPVNFLADLDHDGMGNIRLGDGASIMTKGGDITLHATSDGTNPKGTILMDANSILAAGTGRASLNASTLAMSYGSLVTAKNIDVTAAGVSLVNASLNSVDPSTGTVTIKAAAVSLDNSTIKTSVQKGGVASSVDIDTGTLNMTNGSKLTSDNINVSAGDIHLVDSSIHPIGYQDVGRGILTIKAGEIELTGSELLAPGLITIDTGTLTAIDSRLANTHFVSRPYGGGLKITAGNISLSGSKMYSERSLTIVTGALTATNSRMGNSHDEEDPQRGSVEITAGEITLTGSDLQAAGSMTIDTGSLTATDALIKSGWVDVIPADGTLKLTAGDITLTRSTMFAEGLLSINTGALTATDSRMGNKHFADNPKVGSVEISAGDIALTGSDLQAAGSMIIDTGSLSATNAVIQSGGADIPPPNATLKITAGSIDVTDTKLKSTGSTTIDTGNLSITAQNSSSGIAAAGIKIDAGLVHLDHAALNSSATGDAIRISTGRLTNTGSQLTTPYGRWLVYLGQGYTAFPAADLGDLGYKFVQVNAVETTPTAVSGIGQHGILMADPLAVQIKVDATRPYDGTLKASFTEALSSKTLPGFQVQPRNSDLVLEGTFADKNAGIDKPITYNGDGVPFRIVTSTGAPVYGAEQSYVGDILRKSISASGIVADNKVYDGNRNATLHGSLSGIVAGDNVAFGGASGLFDTKDVGIGKTVTISGGSLSGTDAGNYIVSSNATTTADISAKSISANNLVADNKVYDGNRNATLHGSLSGIITGDKVTLDGATGLFDTKNVGTGKTVTISGGSLSGSDAGNYTLTGGASTTTADITAKSLSANNLTADDKVYDGNRNATVHGSLSGIVAGDNVTLGGASGLFDTKNVGTGKTVTISGGSLSGSDAGNYTLTGGASTTTADITAKSLSANNVTADDKVYDGNRNATVHGSLSGIVAGDNVTLGGASGLFDTKNVGIGKTVTISGGSLSGSDAGNYTLTGGASTTTADITAKSLSANNLTADDKVYDGKRDATVHGTLSGIIAGDSVTLAGATGVFDTKNVGDHKAVTISGGSLAGTDAGNYELTGGAISFADISAKPISADGLIAANKRYDGKRDAALSGSLSGVVAGDSVTLAGATGVFDTKNVGDHKAVTISGGSLAGTDAGNYKLTGGTISFADISAKPISADGLIAANKRYDGKRDAALSGSLSGVVAGDSVTLAGATGVFDTKNVGDHKAVTISGGSLAGTDAGNYELTGGTTAFANITPRSLTIAMTGQVTKEYDATLVANLGGVQFALDGLIANDAVSVRGPAQGSYNTPDVGEHKLVSAGGPFEFSGADVSNYQIGNINLTAGSIVNVAASGNIGSVTPATLTFTATPAVREPGLPVTGLDGTVTGFKGTDSLSSATTGTLLWQSDTTLQSSAGAYAINGAGLNATNYRLVQAPENATALVMKVDYSPNKPQAQAQQSSVLATNSALQSAIPPVDPRGSGGGVFDRSAPGAAKTFSAIRIGSMNQDELAQMLAARREFKRKLFADAIYKLEIDPSLADVQPCATPADASSGACQLTASQLVLMRAAKPQTAPLAKAVHAKAASLPQIERKVIVLFGINNYDDKTIPALENAIPDVDAVAKIFAEKLGYEVRVVRNPNKADIIRTLNALATEMNSDDSVVVYYAGHGYSLEKNGAGYWLPSDAKSSDPRGWISNSDVAKLLSGVSAKQMALISDSCYSGAFAREGMGAVGHDVAAADILNKRSVVVLSSGGDEPVADEGKDGHSIFAWNLMQVVGTVKDWKPGSTIFTNIESGVRKEFPQTPKYGSVTAAGHQPGGDYLFEFR